MSLSLAFPRITAKPRGRAGYDPTLLLGAQFGQDLFDVVGILWRRIPVKAEAGKDAQIHAPGQGPTDEAAGRFESGENLAASVMSLHRGDENVGVGQFFVHFHVCHVDELEARIADLSDEHFRKFLADAIRDALETDT